MKMAGWRRHLLTHKVVLPANMGTGVEELTTACTDWYELQLLKGRPRQALGEKTG